MLTMKALEDAHESGLQKKPEVDRSSGLGRPDFEAIMGLQRAAGNAAVAHALMSPRIQRAAAVAPAQSPAARTMTPTVSPVFLGSALLVKKGENK